MTSWMTKISIAAKIAILCLVPVLAAAGIGFGLLIKERGIANEAERVADAVRLAPSISGLVHELQRERGTSAGFIGSKGGKFEAELRESRHDTDRALTAFRKAFGSGDGRATLPAFSRPAAAAEKNLARLETIRGDITAAKLTAPDSAAFYTSTIADLLALTEAVIGITDDGEIVRALVGWNALLQGKERAGQERAAGATGFGSGTFAPVVHRGFVRLAAQQDTFFGRFRDLATADWNAAWDAALAGPVQKDVDRMRTIAWEAPFGSDVRSVAAQAWFDAASRRIDALKTIEDRVATDIVTVADARAAAARSTFWILAGFLTILAAVTAAISVYVARSISRPVGRLSEVMRRLAENDVAVNVEGRERGDEIGGMARAVAVLRENVVERMRLEGAAEAERKRERDRQAHVDRIVTDFRTTITATLSALGGETDAMRRTAGTLTEVARAASNEAASARSASTGASANVQTVAAASEELAASIREIATQTQKAGAIVGRATETAIATDNDVSSLSEAAEKIGTVVGMIRDIAGQTNLLALNATIEAARAGEMGKGFAVVASEVKALAQQTSVATTEIADQIAGIQASTRGAVDAIRSITKAIGEISALTTTIASAVEEQETATREIAQSVQCASDGTGQVARNVASVDEAIIATSSEAGRVRSASDTLTRAASELSHAVEKFLGDVSDGGGGRAAA
jgi:methyl-accepting chemotaxis protein